MISLCYFIFGTRHNRFLMATDTGQVSITGLGGSEYKMKSSCCCIPSFAKYKYSTTKDQQIFQENIPESVCAFVEVVFIYFFEFPTSFIFLHPELDLFSKYKAAFVCLIGRIAFCLILVLGR